MTNSLVIVDAHVHFHRCFNVNDALSSGYGNFQVVAQRVGAGGAFQGCLLLTEMQGERWFLDQFSYLSQGVSSLSLGDWKLRATSEPSALIAYREDGAQIFVLAGRQVITQEKLEVLALLTPEVFEDGLPLTSAITQIRNLGGLPVLPWAVGKWIGDRGRIVSQFLRQDTAQPICVADNSGRPLGWPYPRNLALAKQLGIPVLRGTDPLPIPSEVNRIGRFGFTFSGTLDAQFPAKDLYAKLTSCSLDLSPYGSLELPWKFFSNQLALRLKK